MKNKYKLIINVLSAILIAFIPKIVFNSNYIPGSELILLYISYSISKIIAYIIAIILLNISINNLFKEGKL